MTADLHNLLAAGDPRTVVMGVQTEIVPATNYYVEGAMAALRVLIDRPDVSEETRHWLQGELDELFSDVLHSSVAHEDRGID